MLMDWKRLPAYRAEPRIDSLIGYYLPEIIGDFAGDMPRGIIPELPIRLGTIRPEHEGTHYSDRSYKVDFYLVGHSGAHYFVEFKTDSKSRRDNQDQYLIEAQEHGMRAVVAGILKIATVSTYKAKYNHLIEKLRGLELINEDREYCGPDSPIQVVYVQPQPGTKGEDRVIDFRWISEWLITKYPNCDFEHELAGALMEWAND